MIALVSSRFRITLVILAATALLAASPAPSVKPLITVVDGDTWRILGGETIRELGIDTPESRYLFGKELWACDAEKLLGERAARRLDELLQSGPIKLETEGHHDRYGRLLGNAILPDGRKAADVLIEEGLAVKWVGRQHDWCGQ